MPRKEGNVYDPRDDSSISEPGLLAEVVRSFSKAIKLSSRGQVAIVDGDAMILSYVKDSDRTDRGKLGIDRESIVPVVIEKEYEFGTRSLSPQTKSEHENHKGKFRGIFVTVKGRPRNIYIGERYRVVYEGDMKNNDSVEFVLESTSPIKIEIANFPPVRIDMALKALREKNKANSGRR